MYVRFVTTNLDPVSGRRQGLFRAAGALRRSTGVRAADLQTLDDLQEWFGDNLPVPSRMSLSPKPHRKAQALCWFRDKAASQIGRMRSYQRVLESYDIQTVMLKTQRPGYVVYADEMQVVAYPFADTPN